LSASLSLDLVTREKEAKKMMTCSTSKSNGVTIRRKVLENGMELAQKLELS
jgi:hypothetical protein